MQLTGPSLVRVPTLHLIVGLPGVGKTTLAMRLEAEYRAVRLTTDDWMLPLFGESDPDGKRDVMEGRLLWVAHRALVAGADVVVDYGCWSPEERWAVRAIAEVSDSELRLHALELEEGRRRARCAHRWAQAPDTTFPMNDDELDRHVRLSQPVTDDELTGPLPPPPDGWATWLSWAAARWPSLPDLSPDRRAT